MQKFFNNYGAAVYYDPELDALFLEYTSKVVNHEQFVIINTAVLDAFIKLHTTKFVADIRKMGVISIESQKWVVENLIPKMIKHVKGKKIIHIQLLDQSEIFSRSAAQKIKDKSNEKTGDMEIIQLTKPEEVKAYLKGILK